MVSSLSSHPRQHYSIFRKEIHTIAATLFPQYGTAGLFSTGITFTDDEWNGANDTPRPYPANPVFPGPAPDGGIQLALARYTQDVKNYETFKLAAAALQQAIIVAVGTTIQMELASLPQALLGNFNLLSITDILQYLDATYGTHTAASIAHLHSELIFRFESADTFASDSSKLSQLYDQLDRAYQGESMAKKMSQLHENSQHIPGMIETFRAYHAANPTLATRTLADAIAFVAIHLPTYQPTTGSAGFTAAITSDTKPQDQTSRIKELEAQLAAATKPAGEKSKPRNQSLFCFHHGVGTHKGSDCKFMAANPTNFTTNMKAARSKAWADKNCA
jgi:hypothetical protein